MDPQVQASFIPKKSLEMGATSRGEGFGLVFLIALLIFVASLVAAGAAFGYTQYLQKSIADKGKSLALDEGAYDPGAIQDLVKLDDRLSQAKILLANHVAVTGIFAFLATQTLPNVSFTTFDYSLGDNGSANISLTGVADSFSTVALQSDQFGGNKLLTDVVFSGITADAQGHIAFSVSATLDKSVLSYSATLGQSAAVVPASTGAVASSSPNAPLQ